MKRYLTLFIILLSFSSTSFAAFRISVLSSFSSKKVDGEDPNSGENGTIVSNGNFTYGLGLSFGLNQHWHFLLGHESKTYAFDNTDQIITGDEAISVGLNYVGLRWILFSRTSLRFLINSEESIAYELDANSKAVIYKDNINYFSMYYDQIVYLGTSIFAGFKVGYEMSASGEKIEEKSGTKYGAFITLNTSGLGQLEAYYELRNITKTDESLEYIENDANLNLTYTVGF